MQKGSGKKCGRRNKDGRASGNGNNGCSRNRMSGGQRAGNRQQGKGSRNMQQRLPE